MRFLLKAGEIPHLDPHTHPTALKNLAEGGAGRENKRLSVPTNPISPPAHTLQPAVPNYCGLPTATQLDGHAESRTFLIGAIQQYLHLDNFTEERTSFSSLNIQ